MPNLFDDPIYTTAADVIASTNIIALQALPVGDIEVLITRAQDAIDSYLQCIMDAPFADPQNWLYPINDPADSSLPYIPLDIQKVTVYVVENLFLLGSPTVASVAGSQITSEKQGPRSVTYGESNNSFDGNLIPLNAQVILDKYKIYSFRQMNGYDVSVYGQGYYNLPSSL